MTTTISPTMLKAALGALLLSVVSAQAQTVTDYRFSIYNLGATTPITTFTFPAAQAVCGQPTVAVTGTVPNPTQIRWQDPASTALDCFRNETAGGPLFALPFSSTLVYQATLVSVSAAGASPESARSNSFTRPGLAPASPVNVRVRP